MKFLIRVLELHLEEGEAESEIIDRGFDEQMVGDILRRDPDQ